MRIRQAVYPNDLVAWRQRVGWRTGGWHGDAGHAQATYTPGMISEGDGAVGVVAGGVTAGAGTVGVDGAEGPPIAGVGEDVGGSSWP